MVYQVRGVLIRECKSIKSKSYNHIHDWFMIKKLFNNQVTV